MIGEQLKVTNAKNQLLEEVFIEHKQALRDFLRARTGLHQEIDDIIQEVFLRLSRLENLDKRMSSQTGSSQAYIFSIANNLILDMQRKDTLHKRYINEKQSIGNRNTIEITPERNLENVQNLTSAKKVIMNLPPKCRRVFLLSRLQQKTYREISDEVGISVKQVEKYISTTLVKLRASAVKK